MKNFLIILLVSSNVFAQDSLGFKTVAFDFGVVNYQIQSVADTNKAWTTLSTINPLRQKDSNLYASPIQTINIYYRAVANMIGGNIYYSNAIYYGQNSVIITNTKISTNWWTDKLTWTAIENNVSYYVIEYSSGSSWVKLVAVVAKGNGSYSYSNSRKWFTKKPNYRLTPYFKDGSAGTIIYF